MDAATAAAINAWAERRAAERDPLPDHVINECADLLAATLPKENPVDRAS